MDDGDGAYVCGEVKENQQVQSAGALECDAESSADGVSEDGTVFGDAG